jgi:hypothetical protein
MMYNLSICCGFSGRGGTWCSLPQLQRWNIFLTRPGRTRASPAKDTTVGITHNTVKRQRLRSMEMKYFWVGDKVAQDAYEIKWHPGQENLADYQNKHHLGAHHQAVCPWYLHEINSSLVLPRAARPNTLKGCVGNLPEGYIQNVLLPRVPQDQSTFQSRVPTVHILPGYYEDMHVIPMYNSTCRIGERVATANSPQWQCIAINT